MDNLLYIATFFVLAAVYIVAKKKGFGSGIKIHSYTSEITDVHFDMVELIKDVTKTPPPLSRWVGLKVINNGPKPITIYADITDAESLWLENDQIIRKTQLATIGRLNWIGPSKADNDGKLEVKSKRGEAYLSVATVIQGKGAFITFHPDKKKSIETPHHLVLIAIRLVGAVDGKEFPPCYFIGLLGYGNQISDTQKVSPPLDLWFKELNMRILDKKKDGIKLSSFSEDDLLRVLDTVSFILRGSPKRSEP